MKIKKSGMQLLAGLCALVLAGGCAFNKVLPSESVESIPNKPYETIIRLYKPDDWPLRPDAGFVYVEAGGRLSTDFPRQIVVKDLAGLNKYEQSNRNLMPKFVIKDREGRIRGYYEMLFDYQTIVWEQENGDILLQVIIPQENWNGEDAGNHFGRMKGRP